MNYQDVLAYLGVGSAHPGGFAATLELVRSLPLKPGRRVLEVGCGTGRTACYLAKEKHLDVTAVDIRELMIEKARLRAIRESVEVNFLVADATQLPFESNTFDIVFAESVTVFTDIKKAMSEYCRVTQHGGVLYDREMCLSSSSVYSTKLKKAIQRVYGAKEVPTFEGWIEKAREAGYRNAGLLTPSLVPEDVGYEDIGLPDFHQEISPEAFSTEAQNIVEENMEFMKEFHAQLGFAVLYATK